MASKSIIPKSDKISSDSHKYKHVTIERQEPEAPVLGLGQNFTNSQLQLSPVFFDCSPFANRIDLGQETITRSNFKTSKQVAIILAKAKATAQERKDDRQKIDTTPVRFSNPNPRERK